MPVTLQRLINNYPAWQVQDMAGGWMAIRRNSVPRTNGLSNIRCGETLDELAANLQAETSPEKTKQEASSRDSLNDLCHARTTSQ